MSLLECPGTTTLQGTMKLLVKVRRSMASGGLDINVLVLGGPPSSSNHAFEEIHCAVYAM